MAQQAPRIALAVCICMLVGEATLMVWRNLPDAAGGPVAAAKMAPDRVGQLAARRAGGTQLASILRANLFGAAPTADVPVVADGDLLLTATFAAADPTGGFAMLGKAADRAAVVGVGALTADGAVLREVYRDRVVIERGGVLMSLALVQRNPQAGGAWMPVAMASPDSMAMATAAPSAAVMRDISFTPPGIPPGISFGSRLAMERDAHPPDLSQVPPPRPLPPDQLEPSQRPRNP